jgi:hypothetical protein
MSDFSSFQRLLPLPAGKLTVMQNRNEIAERTRGGNVGP